MKAEYIRQILQPFKTRLANLLTRSKTVSVDSSKPIYIVLSSVRGKENSENIPMMQHFGFASVPPKDSDQLRAHLSGDPDNPLIIASLNEGSQPTDLLEGDAALFDDREQFIKITENGINIFSPDKDIIINNPNGTYILKVDGSHKMSNGAGSYELKADGSQKSSNAAGSFELEAGGTIDLNGVKIDPAGNILGPANITAAVVIAPSIKANGKDVADHKHGGVAQGIDDTGTNL